MKCLRVLLAILLLPIGSVRASERVISAGGGITEIVCALGLGDRLVGVDSSSTYPQAVTALPQVGYARALSSEGILSLRPDFVLASEDAGPPTTLEHLKKIGVRVILLPSAHDVEATEARIKFVADALGKPERAQRLIEKLREDLASIPQIDSAAKVMFIYARSGGVLNVSGKGTAADAMIRLAGARNAVTDYEGYKPLTAEAAVSAAPDLILVTTGGLADSGGPNSLLSHPGLAATPAGRSGRVAHMDDLLLLGFGPRTGEAARELARLIHNTSQISTAKTR